MRKTLMTIAVTLCGLVVAGCSQTTGSGAGPNAQTVWSGTLATKAYQSWQAAPGYTTIQPAKGPHGKSVRTFIDPVVAGTLSGPHVTAWPVGSMIVKDVYDASGKSIHVEYMQKTGQGWYYGSFGTDGTVANTGIEIPPCKGCHATGSDSVKSFKLP